MHLVTLDFETYFADDYTLSKMTTESYVRDSRFKVHCWGARLGDGRMFNGREGQLDKTFSKEAMLCHHAQFDGLILSHHYNIRPAFWFCTMSMARLLYPHGRHGLAHLAERFGLPQKTVPYHLFKGVRDLPPDVYQLVADGCAHDVELTHEIFKRMLPHVPKDELRLIDLTVRMFTEPALRLDRDALMEYLQRTGKEKEDLLAQCGATREDVQSADKFAGFLRALGVEPPVKISKTTKKETYAFAKTDAGLKDLLEHEDERVQALVAARLGIKSNMVETRAQRLLDMDTRGPLCVYLAYAKAQTLRWAGGDKLNWQNLKRGSVLRSCLRAPEGYHQVVIDASQIEARLLDWFYGQWDYVEKWRAKQDLYSETATTFYGQPITKADAAERGMGKQIILSCGYRAGAESIQNTARIGTYGPPVQLSLEEAKQARDLYRTTHPLVKGGWEICDRTVLPGLVSGAEFPFYFLTVKDHKLLMPGGVWLDYSNLFQEGVNQWNKPAFYRKTVKGLTHMHGGILTQNIMECLARQILAGAMLQLAAKGAKIVTCTHDEIVYLARAEHAEAALQYGLQLLRTPPAWRKAYHLTQKGATENIMGNDTLNRLAPDTLDYFEQQARRDDWHTRFVGSDIRLLIGEIRRLQSDQRGQIPVVDDLAVFDLICKALQSTDTSIDSQANVVLAAILPYLKQPAQRSEMLDNILDAVMEEHDLNVPDGLLASPTGFGAHREAMRLALQKIIPLTLHIEAEYKKATKREAQPTGDISGDAQKIYEEWLAQSPSAQESVCALAHKCFAAGRSIVREYLDNEDVEALLIAYDHAKEHGLPLTAIQSNVDIVRELLANGQKRESVSHDARDCIIEKDRLVVKGYVDSLILHYQGLPRYGAKDNHDFLRRKGMIEAWQQVLDWLFSQDNDIEGGQS